MAVHDFDGALAQWRGVFGAGVMLDAVHDDLDGSAMGIVWMGDVPFLALAADDPDGLVGRWLTRNGPGVQSLAWEVPDMWASQNHLMQAGIGITGVHIEGRHFFMHPRDTFGLMLELTDDRLPGDPRNGLTPTGGGDGLVQVARVERVTGVVVELEPVAELLRTVFGAEPRTVESDGPEAIADFHIGDLTLRLIAPLDDTSEWHDAIVDGRGTLHSVALAVDLDVRARRARGRRHRRGPRRPRHAVARSGRHVRPPPPTGRRVSDAPQCAHGERRMKHWTTYPLIAHPYNPEFVSGEGLARFSRAAEAAGFDGIAFTDHPAPSDKWLNAGGHDALDPFAALPYVAAVTERIRLIPNIVVLPYRNPFHVAKSAATIDVLSGGRFTLSVATGYLRSEYRALGVDFEQRNELFDEALEAMRGVWTTDQYSFEGSGYTAKEISVNPKPCTHPDLDRWQQRPDPASGRAARRRLESVSGTGVAGEDVAHHPARRSRRPRPDARPPAQAHRSRRDVTRHRSTSPSPPACPVRGATATPPPRTSTVSRRWLRWASPGTASACPATASTTPSRPSSSTAPR